MMFRNPLWQRSLPVPSSSCIAERVALNRFQKLSPNRPARASRALLWVIALAILLPACTPRLSKMSAQQRAARLAQARGAVLDSPDPISRGRAYSAIADILVTFISDAAAENNGQQLAALAA